MKPRWKSVWMAPAASGAVFDTVNPATGAVLALATRLRAEGYAVSPDYGGADAVIVNTCGFLDSAKAESLEAIGEALTENGRVIVTGCLGAEPDYITGAHPKVLAVTGPHQYEQVLDAVHTAVPPAPALAPVPVVPALEAA